LITAKQLLKSQEENMKLRENERRQIKNNLITAELENRGKEAQIRHLNEKLKLLQNDLDLSKEELRVIRDKNELKDSNKFQLEITLRDQENELRDLKSKLLNCQAINNVIILN
jgi:hypothetical protein